MLLLRCVGFQCKLNLALLFVLAFIVTPANAQLTTSDAEHPLGIWEGSLDCEAGTFTISLEVERQTNENRHIGKYTVRAPSAPATNNLPLVVFFDGNSKTASFHLNKWPMKALDPDNVQMSGQFDPPIRNFSGRALLAGCQPITLVRVQASQPTNVIEPLDQSIRNTLAKLQADWDNGEKHVAGRKLRALAPEAERYFQSLAQRNQAVASRGDCRNARYLHQAMEQTESVPTIERWRDNYLLACVKEGRIAGDIAGTQWFFVLLADAYARNSPAFDKTMALLNEGANWWQGTSALNGLGALEAGGDALRAGSMVQTGILLSRSAHEIASKFGDDDPRVQFVFRLKEALGWWREGGAAKVDTLLRKLDEIYGQTQNSIQPKMRAAYHALKASKLYASLEFNAAAEEFTIAVRHLRLAENTGNYADLVFVTTRLLTRLAKKHLNQRDCQHCQALKKPVADFVYWLRHSNPSSAYLLMKKGGRDFIDPVKRQEIDRALFGKQISRRFLQTRGSSLAMALQKIIVLGSTPEDVLGFIAAGNEAEAEQFARRTLDRNIDEEGQFGNFGGMIRSLADFTNGLIDHGKPIAAEIAINRIARLWFYGWGNERIEHGTDAHVAYASQLAPLFVELSELESRGQQLQVYTDYLRTAHRMITQKLKREWNISSLQAVPALRELRPTISKLSRLLLTASPSDAKLRREMQTQGFELLQIAMLSDTAAALQLSVRKKAFAARGATGLVERRQLLLLDIQQYSSMAEQQKWLFKPIGAERAADKARRELADVERRIAATGLKLDGGLSDDANVVGISGAARLLSSDEVLLVVNTDMSRSTVAIVTGDSRIQSHITEINTDVLAKNVTQLRNGLKFNKRAFAEFPLLVAHNIYRELFGDLTKELEKARRVISVIAGPLQAIPLSVLVTKHPSQDALSAAAARSVNVAWFAESTAETRIPSIGAYASLVELEVERNRGVAFIGVGNPVLAQTSSGIRSLDLEVLPRKKALADVERLRSLASLPETAEELRAISETLDPGSARLLLGPDANEAEIKSAKLDAFGVLAFATHGVVAGEAFEGNEPGLVLTPPRRASELDDGFLSMTEIAGLRLNADLVLLSACDTATSDGRPMADGLSGLARAFFVAGARNIIATHWSIPSLPSVAVTTNMMRDYMKRLRPTSGQATRAHWTYSLNAAQRSMIKNVGPDEFAHPASWGAFQVIGAD